MRFFLFLLVFISISACNISQYDGYDITSSGIHYKLLYLGDESKPLNEGDLFYASFTVFDDKNEMLYKNQSKAFKNKKPKKFKKWMNGGLLEAFSMLHEGDSISFIIKQEFLEKEGWSFVDRIQDTISDLRIEVKAINFFSQDSYEEYSWVKSWEDDAEMNEQIFLNKYLDKNKLGDSLKIDGIYKFTLEEGQPGKVAKSGDEILVHYIAWTLKGKKIDDTFFMDTPLGFQLGKPDQLLDGFEVGIRHMKKGEEAMFIIPSQKAFGEFGSSDGSVKPYETLVYQVKLIDIK